MIKEALQYLVSLDAPHTIEGIGGNPLLKFCDKDLTVLAPPSPGPVLVETLAALSDLVDAKVDKLDPAKILCHIESFDTVSLVDLEADAWGRRRTYARATIKRTPHVKLGDFVDMDNFVVHLLSGFVPKAGDIEYLTGLASNITSEALDTIGDTGASQTVSVRRGLVLNGQATVRSRVALAPYRTFQEVAQPISDFLFRLRKAGDGRVIGALFEADGGKWKLDAIAAVATFCAASLKGVTVIS